MFIPDYLGKDAWKLPMINRDHFKLKPLLESDENLNDGNEFIKQNYIPWIEFDIQYGHATWLKEILKVEKKFLVFETEYGKGWKYLSIYNKQWNDDLTDSCPAMMSWFRNVFLTKFNITNLQDIKVMALEPNGYSELQHDKLCGQINLPLNDPIGCTAVMFYPNPMDKTKLKDHDYIGRIPFKEGLAVRINTENYHMVKNTSNETRYHVIINTDTKVDKNVETFYNKSIKNTIGNIKKDARI